eukprot:m.41213 g.41213  ORF g.41213 m.41213 type:complete len:478 (-) comp14900_c1_seq1:95-1528(-)
MLLSKTSLSGRDTAPFNIHVNTEIGQDLTGSKCSYETLENVSWYPQTEHRQPSEVQLRVFTSSFNQTTGAREFQSEAQQRVFTGRSRFSFDLDRDTQVEQDSVDWFRAATARSGIRRRHRKVQHRQRRRFHRNSHICMKLLSSRVPTATEANIVSLLQSTTVAALEGTHDTAEDKEDSTSNLDTLGSIENLCTEFLRVYGSEIRKELGPSARLVRAPVSQNVVEDFWSKCALAGTGDNFLPGVAYHGTAKKNFQSILSRGLLVPSSENGINVVHGSSCGVGIYTTVPGSMATSKCYCDSQDILILATIDLPDGRLTSTATSNTLRSVPRPGRTFHKQHRKAPREHQNHSCDKSIVYRTFGGVKVFYKSGYVLPLFIGNGAQSQANRFCRPPTRARLILPNAPGQSPNKRADSGQPWVGRRCTYVAEVDAVVWLPPTPADSSRTARRLKRRHTARQRSRARRWCRDDKTSWRYEAEQW